MGLHVCMILQLEAGMLAGPVNPNGAKNACGGKCCTNSKGYECVLETNDGEKYNDYYCCALSCHPRAS